MSDQGRVRSLFRVVRARDGGRRDVPGRVLRPGLDPNGYHRLCLHREGTAFTRKVHRLVLEAFVGPCPDGMMCCHANGVRNDNRLENLRWDTASANMMDRVQHGNNPSAEKIECPKGHPYEGRNLIERSGRRHCRKCSNAASAAYHRNNPADISRRTHGLVGTYTSAGCRCDPCKTAAREWRMKRAAAKGVLE